MPLHSPQNLFDQITRAVSTFLVIVFFFTLQYILDMDFVCSCSHTTSIHCNGVLYMVAPPVILTWAVNKIQSLQPMQIFSRKQRLIYNKYCRCCVRLLFSFFSLNGVWAAAVLVDGDWYFCLMTNRNESQVGIPCKEKLDYDERRIEAHYKSQSMDYGYYVFFGVILFWIIVEFMTIHCGRKKMDCCCGLFKLCNTPFYKMVYKYRLKEQVNSYLRKELNKIAKEQAEAICKPLIEKIHLEESESNRTSNDNVSINITESEAWWTISKCYLDSMEPEEQPDLEARPQTTNQEQSSGSTKLAGPSNQEQSSGSTELNGSSNQEQSSGSTELVGPSNQEQSPGSTELAGSLKQEQSSGSTELNGSSNQEQSSGSTELNGSSNQEQSPRSKELAGPSNQEQSSGSRELVDPSNQEQSSGSTELNGSSNQEQSPRSKELVDPSNQEQSSGSTELNGSSNQEQSPGSKELADQVASISGKEIN
ncbi:uncharacterized protein LOC117495849 isoform X2 [Trematomus bernacchii]|uniref:uncharacterized protein LOC117495849 isoform X2 n=1 Tax=Trematomus bernacchii TaxID=40690 RepID=UPI00146B8A1B|nr:uncharacterized protein LOC117495849 isoform X2 [Trematomus bernacchii]